MKKIQAIVYTDGTFDTIENYQAKQTREMEYLQKKKSDEEKYRFIDDNFGSFYFNNYNKLLAKDLEPQMLFRFAYLCTFLDYENNLRFGAANEIMLERDLQEVLRLSEREARNTKNSLIKSNLLKSENKKLSINQNFCIKGGTQKMFLEKGVIRMFEDGIKNLYEQVAPKDHKKLGVLIKILPYIHNETNIICKNPSETDNTKIDLFTMNELAEAVGYLNGTKLRKTLWDIKIDNQNVIMVSIIDKKRAIIVNPKVYYKGSDMNQMKGLIKIFEALS